MSEINVKIKKLSENAVIPKYANPGDAGVDLVATSVDFKLENGIPFVEYGTGLSIELPEGYVADIRPRSSITSKTTMIIPNSPGTIDSSYRGEIKIRMKSILLSGALKYNVGDRVAQLVILPAPKVNFIEESELSDTERGECGFGSSGE